MCVTNTTYRASNPLSLSTSQVLLNASLPQPPVFPSTVPSVFDTKPTSKRRRAPQKPGKTAKNQERHFVVHNYHDHSLDEEVMEAKPRRGGLAGSFPVKLHTVLSQVEADGFSHIISWQPHGRCFVIHKPKEFVEHIMPRYFRQSKLTSFQRQLNLYGFQRLTRGTDAGGYYNEFFLRGKPNLCKNMSRTKVKGTRFKAASSPDQEPNFYAMPPVSHGRSVVQQQQQQGPPVCVSPPMVEPMSIQTNPLPAAPMVTTSCWPEQHSVVSNEDSKMPEQIIDELFLNNGQEDPLDSTLADFLFDWDPNAVESANNTVAVDNFDQDASLNYMLDQLLQD